MSIREVIEKLDGLVFRWDSEGDYRAVFACSYRTISVRMEQAVEDHEFEDNPWMEALTDQFAKEYFDALDAYDSGTGHLPTCWELAFDLARQKKTTVLQDLLLGMSAHILHDLAIASYKMGLVPTERELRERDYEKVSDILAGMIDDVQDDVTRRYSWILKFLDRLSGRRDELLTDVGIRASRKNAWLMALELTDAPDDATRGTILRTLDDMASVAARLIASRRSVLRRLIQTLRRWDRALGRALSR